jgi:hypothetical protein
MSASHGILLIAFPGNSDHQGIVIANDERAVAKAQFSPMQGYPARRDFTDSMPMFAVSNDAGSFCRRDYIRIYGVHS